MISKSFHIFYAWKKYFLQGEFYGKRKKFISLIRNG
ncbi:MAG TPA: hypothetical protein DHV15_00275 [Treponema sp.]|uniref:Uncharacterized protein n=1 Tax=Treponema denticola (strain ATCC 35405 / DSM 14222 / CIP 103919 / JCM 8153 / KCTC 15104) TaxID=243275 RepID=Q73M11_TREDE|nr:hypothetical protein TDE_1700 [Treponema denticola ATCC 35405]HCY93938.1 hypothetical protein [Treponema sp.]